MSKKTYKVTVPQNFPYDSRQRAGVTVPKEGGYVGELTDEQVKAIEADPALTIETASASEAKEAGSTPATGSADETVTASGRVPNDTSGHGNPEGETGYAPDAPFSNPAKSGDEAAKTTESTDGQASLKAVPKKRTNR